MTSKMTLTEKYEFEEEIDQLEKKIEKLWWSCKAKDDTIESKTCFASVFARKTRDLLLYLGLTEKDIASWYNSK